MYLPSVPSLFYHLKICESYLWQSHRIPVLGLCSAVWEFLFFAEESLVGQGFDPKVGNMSDLQWNKIISINNEDQSY